MTKKTKKKPPRQSGTNDEMLDELRSRAVAKDLRASTKSDLPPPRAFKGVVRLVDDLEYDTWPFTVRS